MPNFVVLQGRNRGAVLHLLPGTNRLGRDPKLELSLPDERVSREHASIALDGADGYLLRDLGSKNATYLNGIRLTDPRAIAHGDELRLGGTVMLFVDSEAADYGDAASVHGGTVTALSDVEPTTSMARRTRVAAPALPRSQYLIGEGPALRRLSEQVARCAPLDTTVLVTGESGTGKELIARALHRLGARRRAPFAAVNSATLRPELFASELFGHERGAFTGAIARRIGTPELAQEGTVFLDEVAELPLEAQAQLLRAIEQREFQRVGGSELLR